MGQSGALVSLVERNKHMATDSLYSLLAWKPYSDCIVTQSARAPPSAFPRITVARRGFLVLCPSSAWTPLETRAANASCSTRRVNNNPVIGIPALVPAEDSSTFVSAEFSVSPPKVTASLGESLSWLKMHFAAEL